MQLHGIKVFRRTIAARTRNICKPRAHTHTKIEQSARSGMIYFARAICKWCLPSSMQNLLKFTDLCPARFKPTAQRAHHISPWPLRKCIGSVKVCLFKNMWGRGRYLRVSLRFGVLLKDVFMTTSKWFLNSILCDEHRFSGLISNGLLWTPNHLEYINSQNKIIETIT